MKSKKNKKFSLKENYKLCWKFFCESRWYIVFALGIFAASFLVGFAFPVFFNEEIFSLISEIIESLGDKTGIELIAAIFFNNLKAAFIAIISGFAFGILPMFIAISNGYLIGFVSRYAVGVEGIFTLWKLVPHGIFELPAIIISIGIGIKIGFEVFMKNGSEKIGHNIFEGLRFFFFVILPLLLVAGIIEGILVGFVR